MFHLYPRQGFIELVIGAVLLIGSISCSNKSDPAADDGGGADADTNGGTGSIGSKKQPDTKKKTTDQTKIDTVISDHQDPDYPCIGVVAANLEAIKGSCAFPKDKSRLGPVTMAVVLEDDDIALISKNTDGALVINGQTCGDKTIATEQNVRRLEINGSDGTNTVVLDFSLGALVPGSETDKSYGIWIDLKGGDLDTLKIKGSVAVSEADAGTEVGDKIVCGANAEHSSYGFNINDDFYLDVNAVNIEDFVVSLGPGNDVFSAAGSKISNAIEEPFDLPITVCGGAGDDVFEEGAAAAQPAGRGETISGGDGIDTVDYSLRKNAVNATINAGDIDDGEEGEADDIRDVELIKGGDGDDALTQDPACTADSTLWGNGGDDTLTGALGNDTLWGGPGNDTFLMLSSIDGSDTYNGEDGTDTISYAGRTGDLVVVLDGETKCGEQGEGDIVGSDVENLVGGDGNDTLTGNDSRNKITGGKGDDVISGLAGDDTFIEEPTAANSGNDIYIGGDDADTVTYAARTSSGEGVTIAIDHAADSGKSDGSETDTIECDIENLIGTSLDDVLTGHTGGCESSPNTHDNELSGGPGEDVLNGGDGDDIIDGDSDNDTIDCGLGIDICLDSAPDCQLAISCEM
jgi:Ca2+-binding RTX toxin-like protein